MAIEQGHRVCSAPASRRAIRTWLTSVLVWLVVFAPGRGHAAEYTLGSAPAWVAPVERGTVDKTLLGQIKDGTYYLLSDAQTRIDADERVRYRRFASKAINAEGVQTIANIEIGFDPSFETLILHSIDVVRDGRVIGKLADATVNILQRETELEWRIYDGSKTASIFLDDVRVGDTVDYAFSIRGRNPVFKGRDFGNFPLGFSVPVGRVHARLLSATAEPVIVKVRNTALKPVITERNGLRSQSWEHTNVAPTIADSNQPGWYDPDPIAQWSEFIDWAAVARWATQLYALPKTLSPALQAEIDAIGKAETTASARMLAVLRSVQSEVRYLGVEIGAGSHAPNPPSLVFERRFGDCKDKALLMVAMLDRLGIDANIALVNTRLARGLKDRLASPNQFDHAIVQARIAGKTWWLDPTRSTQKADLAHIVQADFDLALLVDASTRSLTSMKDPAAQVPKRTVRATFDATHGLEQPVSFSVVTTIEGATAESFRNSMASSNLDELQKQYLNYYATYYRGIAVAAPLTIADDETNNRITYTEKYAIADFSSWSESDKRFTAKISTPDTVDLLQAPASPIRTSPMWLAHPVDVTVTTEALLPEEWPIEAETLKVEDPVFRFERAIKPGVNRFVIDDRFRSLADEISAADMGRYAGNLAKARQSTAYELYWDAGGSAVTPATGVDRVNWLLVIIGVMMLAIFIWLAVRLYHYDPPPSGEVSRAAPRGIGGWLGLAAFGLLISPIIHVFALIRDADVWSADTWAALTTYGNEAYNALWAPLLLYTLAADLGRVVFSILLIILFFRRRTSAPRVYIGVLIAVHASVLLDLVLPTLIPGNSIEATDLSRVVFGVLAAALWIGYFLSSERVKATFVVRLRKAVEVPVESGAGAAVA